MGCNLTNWVRLENWKIRIYSKCSSEVYPARQQIVAVLQWCTGYYSQCWGLLQASLQAVKDVVEICLRSPNPVRQRGWRCLYQILTKVRSPESSTFTCRPTTRWPTPSQSPSCWTITGGAAQPAPRSLTTPGQSWRTLTPHPSYTSHCRYVVFTM